MNQDAQLFFNDEEEPVCIWRVAFECETTEGLSINETMDVAGTEDGEKAIKKARSRFSELSEEMDLKPEVFKLQGLRLLAKSEVK